MLPIQQKILSVTGNDIMFRTKISVIKYIYDDIVELKNQGVKEPAIHKIISNTETKFSISLNLLKQYIFIIRKSRKLENISQTNISNDWSKIGITSIPLINRLEANGYTAKDVINWNCKGEAEIIKKLLTLKTDYI